MLCCFTGTIIECIDNRNSDSIQGVGQCANILKSILAEILVVCSMERESLKHTRLEELIFKNSVNCIYLNRQVD